MRQTSSYPKYRVCVRRATGQKPLECLLSPLQLLLLRRAIELLCAFVRQIVHPLTAATFGDWLSPRAQARYHKFRTITTGLDDYNCLITTMVESRLQCYGIFLKFQREGFGVPSSPTYISIVLCYLYNLPLCFLGVALEAFPSE